MEFPSTRTRRSALQTIVMGLFASVVLAGATPAFARLHPANHRIESRIVNITELSAFRPHQAGVQTAHRFGRTASPHVFHIYRARLQIKRRIAHAPSVVHAHESPARVEHGGSGGVSGLASVYGEGSATASGERLNPGAMTAAHRTLPFGTLVTVTNRNNGHTVVVRINDRGPFVRGRVIDLTPAAARAIGVNGLAPVSLKVGSSSL